VDGPVTSVLYRRNHRQDQMRRSHRIVEDGLVGRDVLGISRVVATGVQIPAETREVAAADGQRDPMSGLELVAGVPQVDLVANRLSRRQQLCPIKPVSESCPDDAV